MSFRVVLIGSLVAAVVAIPACGGGGSEANKGKGTITTTGGASATATRSSINVEAGDLFFKPKELTANAGNVDISYQNSGQLLHTLLIEGLANFKLTVDPGGKDQGMATLTAGTYKLYCDVPGHRAAGMEASLTVS